MLYHRFLAEPTGRKAPSTFTSAEIAEALDIDPTQVRKDLASIGVRGRGRVGFDANTVILRIRAVLGFDKSHIAIVVGAGNLGSALTLYRGFARYGLRIIAAFDNDPARIGRNIGGCPVRHTRTLKPFIARHQVRLAILATPAEAAQKAADRLAAAGIRAIWNFTPTRLVVPPSVAIRDEHISLGFAQLAYHLSA
jgi:redox-sensing transcriptional repressor